MEIELTVDQEATLDDVARVDDWSTEPTTREELGRRVRLRMHDGTRFQEAVFAVLESVDRPPDPPKVDPAKEELKAKIAAMQAARTEAFLKLTEAGKRGLLNESQKNRIAAAIGRDAGVSAAKNTAAKPTVHSGSDEGNR